MGYRVKEGFLEEVTPEVIFLTLSRYQLDQERREEHSEPVVCREGP